MSDEWQKLSDEKKQTKQGLSFWDLCVCVCERERERERERRAFGIGLLE